jgi:hypothetical protein
MDTIQRKLDLVKERFYDEAFLNNRGLGNEVGIHVFSYQPKEELLVRSFTKQLLKNQDAYNFRIHEYDLYEIFLTICEEKRVINNIPSMEEKRGKDYLLENLQKFATPEAFISKINIQDLQKGRDILLLTGIGKVYPFMRSHSILNKIQNEIIDVPIVLFYPGVYTSHELELFGKIKDENYYRAFSLI